VTRDPLESRVEGGLTGVFRNQRKVSFYFIQILHSEVAWEAQSSILSVKLDMNIRGTTPQEAPPQKRVTNAGGCSIVFWKAYPIWSGIPRGDYPPPFLCPHPYEKGINLLLF
jgi:hypothetical protein